MAIFQVIDTTASGDYFDDGMVKDAANWAIVESSLSAATTHILVGGGAGVAPVMTAATGTGAPVRATSPTLVTPVLGTPSSGTLTNCTGLPVVGGGTGRATGTTAYALVATGTTATGAQQTLASGATTEILVGGGASALPIWTTATGTGAPVRATSPTLVTPALGTPSSGVLSSCTAGTEGAKGVLALATTAEVTTGTDTAKAVTSAGVGAHAAVTATHGATGAVAGTTNTQTFTNKRITKRTGTTTSSATPTINTDNVDFYSLTAQAVDITSFTTNLSGTPTENQTLWIAITGTAARAITWGASFEASTVALPTTTVTTNRLDVGFVWNSSASKWRCVAKA